jgi:hypothetical protein
MSLNQTNIILNNNLETKDDLDSVLLINSNEDIKIIKYCVIKNSYVNINGKNIDKQLNNTLYTMDSRVKQITNMNLIPMCDIKFNTDRNTIYNEHFYNYNLNYIPSNNQQEQELQQEIKIKQENKMQQEVQQHEMQQQEKEEHEMQQREMQQYEMQQQEIQQQEIQQREKEEQQREKEVQQREKEEQQREKEVQQREKEVQQQREKEVQQQREKEVQQREKVQQHEIQQREKEVQQQENKIPHIYTPGNASTYIKLTLPIFCSISVLLCYHKYKKTFI